MSALGGRRAFVTGASSGIGRATARALAEAGAEVALAGRAGEALADLADELDGRAKALECDVRDPGAVARAVREAVSELGGIDIVVPAAGLGRFARTDRMRVDAWDEVVETNLRGTFLVFRETLPHVRRARGHLFAIASVAAMRPFAESGAYCASKAGVRALAQVVAEEVRREGVRVTTIVPGAVDTEFWDRAGGTHLDRERMLRPEDVARTILHAVSVPAHASMDEIVLMPAEGVL
ncbi:MAG TPA: SDR family NAD(P)-dependent oxidoreductase [Candidatus Limnocylindria bacterium]|jgi:NADP-dependent 3-hydroxy acid dehydrogenase YdfG|nr:SDR family NAD(P)-dependent oxidoreductase [Candidatus Limnocylindria bacterium]